MSQSANIKVNINTRVEKEGERMSVLYICDRKKCGEKCRDCCKHTTDIMHAANFTESKVLPGMMIEVEKEEPPKGCQNIHIETVPFPTKTENDVGPSLWLVLSVVLWAVTVAVTIAAAVV